MRSAPRRPRRHAPGERHWCTGPFPPHRRRGDDGDLLCLPVQDGVERADVSIIRLPVDQSGPHVQPLFTEPRLAVLPIGHPLAERSAVTVLDPADDHLLQDPDAVPEWRDVARELRTGECDDVPALHSVEEKLELVAAGAGICVLPLSTAAFCARPDVVAVPVDGIGPATRRSRPIQDFADAFPSLAPTA
ncbi:LysR family transcriptional regulator substrate-binding protein [Streptomyces sp. NPDC001811]